MKRRIELLRARQGARRVHGHCPLPCRAVALAKAGRFVIDLSFAPNAQDIALFVLRFARQRFPSRADHLASTRSRPPQHSPPAGSVLLCPGLEQSTVFAPVTMPAQS